MLNDMEKLIEGPMGSMYSPGNIFDIYSRSTAALFRGREFFRTKSGLFGLGSPGVHGIKAGDDVILLDGLSCPLVARPCGQSQHTIVGCSNVREITLKDKYADANLPPGYTLGARNVFMFR
jgi:hypothetical protein